jgi:hypothetical protein
MKKVFPAIYVVLVFMTACNTQREAASPKAEPGVQRLPFSLSVVPERSHGERFGSSIEMAHSKPRDFYVVLTNVSAQPQAVWESWNSWGYQAISFEITTADGKKFVVAKRQEGFTRNGPATFIVEPGEHQVYAIRLDEGWETHPPLPKADEMSITLKTIYEVSPTPESTQYNVWVGRVESHIYNFTLR